MDVDGEKQLREQWQSMHERLHEAEDHAREISSIDINRRLGEMNQFRDQILQERADFLTRDVYERTHSALRDMLSAKIEANESATDIRLKLLENASSNWQGRWWAVGTIVALSMTVAGLLLRSMRL